MCQFKATGPSCKNLRASGISLQQAHVKGFRHVAPQEQFDRLEELPSKRAPTGGCAWHCMAALLIASHKALMV